MNKVKNDVPYGTLDLMVLKTLELGPLHGFGLARRIEQVSENLVKLNEKIQEKNLELKRFLRKNLYQHERVQVMTDQARQTVRALFERYMADSGLLPGDIQENMAEVQQPEKKARMVADYIAGMTDRYAIAEFERITQ